MVIIGFNSFFSHGLDVYRARVQSQLNLICNEACLFIFFCFLFREDKFCQLRNSPKLFLLTLEALVSSKTHQNWLVKSV